MANPVESQIRPNIHYLYQENRKEKTIQIGWLPYAKVKDIKSKVQEICNEKGIEVAVAEYTKA